MEEKAAPSFDFYKLWAWVETNRKQVGRFALAVVILGVLAAYFFWLQSEKEVDSSEALSKISVAQATGESPRPDPVPAYLKIAADYPKSSAGARAILLAAGSLFVDEKYDQAKAQFEKFTREHRDSPLLGQALLGIAACLDAQGRTSDAFTAYKNLVDRHPTDIVISQAKFALARLYEAQNNPEQARFYFEQLAREPYGSIASEAGIRLEELLVKYPRLAAPPVTTTSTSTITVPSMTNALRVVQAATNAPLPSVPVTGAPPTLLSVTTGPALKLEPKP